MDAPPKKRTGRKALLILLLLAGMLILLELSGIYPVVGTNETEEMIDRPHDQPAERR